MLYLLDANVLITASNQYYAIDQVPEFWEWISYQAKGGYIKMPNEILSEVKEGTKKDPLLDWIKKEGNGDSLLLKEDVDQKFVQRVVNEGYADDLTDDELCQLGYDPFLIAYAMAKNEQRCVVTLESSKPKKQRQNRHVPDVCASLKVKCCDTFGLTRSLRFRTSWNR